MGYYTIRRYVVSYLEEFFFSNVSQWIHFFFGRKWVSDGYIASTSTEKSFVPKVKSKRYCEEYLHLGLTNTDVTVEEEPLFKKMLVADSMKPFGNN